MLYLEDYLEMIENLPMEMTDRFTEMREMDLQVQNAMDSLDDKVKTFFSKCKSTPSLKQEWRDEHFQKLKQEYQKALEDADEKVQMANQIYELVERYLRKLDQELAKFKMELEADNAGITEVLERRSLELDKPALTVNNHRGEKRKYASNVSNHVEKRATTEKVLSSLASEAARETLGGMTRSSSTPVLASLSASSPAISYSLGHVGAGSNAALAKAASRAIGATLEMPHGRRTASLKASYDALTKNEFSKEVLSGGTTTPANEPAPTPPPPSKSSRSKKSGSRASQQAAQQAAQAAQQAAQAQAAAKPKTETLAADTTEVADPNADPNSTNTTWAYDPNEPRYCLCNEVSYGDMVGCDNDDCPIEWFHYGCVGLTQAPKGKWFCPQCTADMKRRGRK